MYALKKTMELISLKSEIVTSAHETDLCPRAFRMSHMSTMRYRVCSAFYSPLPHSLSYFMCLTNQSLHVVSHIPTG